LFSGLRKEINANILLLEKYLAEVDPIEYVRVELGIAVQHARLEMLDRWSS
jgi:hypothetical protein